MYMDALQTQATEIAGGGYDQQASILIELLLSSTPALFMNAATVSAMIAVRFVPLCGLIFHPDSFIAAK